MHGTWNA